MPEPTEPAVISVDPDSLTLGEAADVEEASGLTIFDITVSGKFTALALAALVWVTKRRTDPTYTLEDAKALKIADLADQFDVDETKLPPDLKQKMAERLGVVPAAS